MKIQSQNTDGPARQRDQAPRPLPLVVASRVLREHDTRMRTRIEFGDFAFDLDAMELLRDGSPIQLQAQPLLVLAALLQRHGAIVSRADLKERIWCKDTFVDFDQSINKAVSRLRSALGDEPDRPVYIKTVPRRGYRSIAPIRDPLLAAPPAIRQERTLSTPTAFRLLLALIAVLAIVTLGTPSPGRPLFLSLPPKRAPPYLTASFLAGPRRVRESAAINRHVSGDEEPCGKGEATPFWPQAQERLS